MKSMNSRKEGSSRKRAVMTCLHFSDVKGAEQLLDHTAQVRRAAQRKGAQPFRHLSAEFAAPSMSFCRSLQS